MNTSSKTKSPLPVAARAPQLATGEQEPPASQPPLSSDCPETQGCGVRTGGKGEAGAQEALGGALCGCWVPGTHVIKRKVYGKAATEHRGERLSLPSGELTQDIFENEGLGEERSGRSFQASVQELSPSHI